MSESQTEILHGALLQMLKDFDAFCEENGLVYFLSGGTMLGAVRHRGFIPWDDDADVCMDVRNYRKLLRLRDKLPPRYFLQDFRSEPKIGSKWATLRMNGTTCMAKHLTSYDIHFGVGMDIFPMYGIAGTRVGRAVQRLADGAMNTLLYKDWAQAQGKPVSGRMRLLYALLPGRLRIGVLSLLEHILLLDTHHGDYTTALFYDLRNGGKLLPAPLFLPEERIRVPFEDAELPVPRRYEEYLSVVYGDWRTPLPPEERVSHADYILDLAHDYRDYYTGT